MGQPSGDLERHLRAGARGDVTAFAEIYEAVAPTVYGLALRILDDVPQAEEVTEEVLLQVWQTAARFDPAQGSAVSWVLALAHRTAVERARAVALGRDWPDEQTTASGRREGDATQAAWQQLSADQRRALELAYFGGHTHSEIGRLLSLPLDAAQNRIRDALLTLKSLLEPGPGVEETAG